ncbi:Uncharacterised protein [Serratia plymuthica]|nr:Uncharacterised protein [Serratia plymuthica]
MASVGQQHKITIFMWIINAHIFMLAIHIAFKLRIISMLNTINTPNNTPFYTNELTPEILAEIDQSPFTQERLAEMNDEARAIIEKQNEYVRQHPVTDIYRIAVAGCLTRRGGTGDEFNPNPEEGHKIQLDNGQWASVLTEGCTVTYPDGTQARIVTCAGSHFTCSDGKGMALVNSLLDNGDEIISTPQSRAVLVGRAGESMPEDFLAMPGA